MDAITRGREWNGKRVGNVTSDLAERPEDRADVARFYATFSPGAASKANALQLHHPWHEGSEHEQ
jgi:hypothetical protein